MDQDGTTHVVWLQTPSDNSGDKVLYCQIPRGATACKQPATTLAWPASPDDPSRSCTRRDANPPSNQTGTNRPYYYDGPQIHITAFGDVYVVSHAFCPPEGADTTVYQPPDHTVYWHSADNGATFDTGHASANQNPATPTGSARWQVLSSALDPGNDQIVYLLESPFDQGSVNIGNVPTGQSGTAGLSAPISSNAGGNPTSIVQRGPNSFAAAWTQYAGDGQYAAYYSTYDCSSCTGDDVSSAGNWSTPQAVPADPNDQFASSGAPILIAGPSGTFLFYVSQSSGDGQWWWVRKLDGSTLGDPVKLAEATALGTDRYNAPAASEDPATGQLLFAAPVSDQGHIPPGDYFQYLTSADGATWSSGNDLLPDEDRVTSSGETADINNPVLASNTGQQGFTGVAVWTQAGSDQTDPDVELYYLPGSGIGGDCHALKFAALDIKADGCLSKEGSQYVARGTVKVDGLKLAGGTVRFDPSALTVKSDGPISITLGSTKLYQGTIDWKVPKVNIWDFGSLDVGALGSKLLGFGISGSAGLKFIRGGAEVSLHLELPKLFGNVSGDISVRVDNQAGIHLGSLHVKAPTVFIGPLLLKNLEFSYNAGTKAWSGGAKLLIPPQPPSPSLESHIGFKNGEFQYLQNELTLPGEGIPIDPFDAVWLTKIRFGLAVDPLTLNGGVTFSAGPKFGDLRVASVDGDMKFVFPSTGPATLRAQGTGYLFGIRVGDEFLQFVTDGHVTFGAHVDLSVASFGVKGGLDGWFYKGNFSVEGSAKVCLGDLGCVLGGHVVFSSTGFAACVDTPLANFGAGLKWGPASLWVPSLIASIHPMFTGCDVGPYTTKQEAHVARAARSGAGSVPLRIAAHLPSAFIGVSGKAGPPAVMLVGPHGERIKPPADAPLRTATAIAFHVPSEKTTWFVLKNPAAGTWHLQTLSGSTPVVGIKQAGGLPQPQIKASVSGQGENRTLTYKIKPVPGQTVTFAERGTTSAAAMLGPAKGAHGTIHFHPTNGPAGRRTIVALVSSNGVPRESMVVASYVAPAPPGPAKPPHLLLTRRASRLLVTWKPASGVASYRVKVKLSDGRELEFVASPAKRIVSVAAVGKNTTGTVSVTGVAADGVMGPPASAKLTKAKH